MLTEQGIKAADAALQAAVTAQQKTIDGLRAAVNQLDSDVAQMSNSHADVLEQLQRHMGIVVGVLAGVVIFLLVWGFFTDRRLKRLEKLLGQSPGKLSGPGKMGFNGAPPVLERPSET